MKRLLTLGAIGSAFALALPAAAQSGLDFENTRLSLRAGGFVPIDEDTRDLDNFWFAAGVDFEFDASLVKGAVTVISVDWLTRVSGARDNAFPIVVSQRWYSSQDPGRRSYWHVGIGATASDFRPADILFTARAGIGLEMNERVFFEANIMWSDEDHGNRSVTGGTAFVGIRF